MDDIETPLIGSGADGTLLEDFRTLADGGRYIREPVLKWLAKFIVGNAGGPNRDSPIYELCHLAAAVDAAGAAPDRRALFFLGTGRASPRLLRDALDDALAAGGWRRAGFERTKDGIEITTGDGGFQVRFGRMPFLVALYEFLAAMDGFAFYAELGEILDGLGAGPLSDASVRAATGRIASRMRQYRRAHMDWAAHEEKFDRIFAFLSKNSAGERLSIDDGAVLDFWLLHSEGDEFRGYRTVFDAFVTFMHSLAAAAQGRAAAEAVPLGTDFEAGEVDPDPDKVESDGHEDWRSPFEILDSPLAGDIKFFKAASERAPLETLMKYGPDAIRLPLAFLRLEAFGPVQAGITNDLQVKRGAASVARRLGCEDARSYDGLRDGYAGLRDHVARLQLASFHAVRRADAATGEAEGNVVRFPAAQDDAISAEAVAEIERTAERAFAAINRKGFEPLADDAPERAEAFRVAAGALVLMTQQIDAMLARMQRLDGKPSSFPEQFAADRDTFSRQFTRIYGEVS